MPSDDRRQGALAAVARERAAFRSAVAAALENVRLMVATAAPHDQLVARAAVQLGPFADGRLDARRFGELFAPAGESSAERARALRQTQNLLSTTLELGDDVFFLPLPAGSDLPVAVHAALAAIGRLFAAADVVAGPHVVSGRPADDYAFAPLPPASWTRGQRGIAPPLVVELEGADLRAGGLDDVLQGAQKIVLLVNGVCPPAPLVRAISPSVFVQQCRSIDELGAFSAFEGPAIAAVMPEGARFRSTPSAAGPPRIVIEEAASGTRRRVGHITRSLQSDEVRWLELLAGAFGGAAQPQPVPAVEKVAVQPGDQLAAWILRQAQL